MGNLAQNNQKLTFSGSVFGFTLVVPTGFEPAVGECIPLSHLTFCPRIEWEGHQTKLIY